MAKNTAHAKCQLIVNRFCGHNPKLYWAREIKIAKQLLKLEPEVSVWLSLEHRKLSSLSWFLTDDGKLFIKTSKLKKDINIEEVSNPEVEEEKIGEDKIIDKKPKSLLDFLRKES